MTSITPSVKFEQRTEPGNGKNAKPVQIYRVIHAQNTFAATLGEDYSRAQAEKFVAANPGVRVNIVPA